MNNAERLTAIEALAAAATPGPWGYLDSDPWGEDPCVKTLGLVSLTDICRNPETDDRPDDMAFIAAAREAVPWLVARVRELEAEVQSYSLSCETRGPEEAATWIGDLQLAEVRNEKRITELESEVHTLTIREEVLQGAYRTACCHREEAQERVKVLDERLRAVEVAAIGTVNPYRNLCRVCGAYAWSLQRPIYHKPNCWLAKAMGWEVRVDG